METRWLNARRRGYANTLGLIAGRVWLRFLWHVFRMRHRGDLSAVPGARASEVDAALARKEENVRDWIVWSGGRSFLEIGIGHAPMPERVRLLNERGIRYTACDFESVCEIHERELGRLGLRGEGMRFLGNRTGTYAWTLHEMLACGESFDLIYLDGHHTFYVDLPAILLAHELLKPGGSLLVDDVDWTLDFMKHQMLTRFEDWRFYRSGYDFSMYTPEQRRVPHMKPLAELLIWRHGYRKIERHSSPSWWALQKP